MARRKPVIGIIGGIGSGKSTVARHFEKLGAVVLDADRIGHEMLGRDEVKRAACRRWGKGILDADGRINRRKVARIVFGRGRAARAELEYLQGLVHPLIGQRLRDSVAQAQRRGKVPAIVIDAALLVEAGWDRECDYVVYVEADRQQRIERVQQARGWSAEEAGARQRAQDSLKLKRERADYVVDNSGSLDATLRQVERLFSRFLEHPPSPTSQ